MYALPLALMPLDGSAVRDAFAPGTDAAFARPNRLRAEGRADKAICACIERTACRGMVQCTYSGPSQSYGVPDMSAATPHPQPEPARSRSICMCLYRSGCVPICGHTWTQPERNLSYRTIIFYPEMFVAFHISPGLFKHIWMYPDLCTAAYKTRPSESYRTQPRVHPLACTTHPLVRARTRSFVRAHALACSPARPLARACASTTRPPVRLPACSQHQPIVSIAPAEPHAIPRYACLTH
ncbi:hypothetical protein C8Q73DRAFT_539164 [Cubamyces lactineus]|nr:hypothetical protein C8Q73DRAFT_539164 [Cubamyces lactineus]